MMDMRSESLRAQLERPLSERNVLFAILSVFLLLPLSVVWSFVAYLRLLLRSKRSISSTDDVRVVSVGNVSVGGTGKSPVVRSVALLAFQEGYDVAVLTRGYVSSGSVPQVIVQVRSGFVAEPDTSWTLLSDETLEHALQLQSRVNESHSLWVCQGKDRRVVFDALVAQWRESQAEQASSSPRKLAVIMDDALQQTSIPVHRDLIVWSPETVHKAPQMCLPYGPYRMGLPFRRFWSWAVPTGDVVVWSRLRSLSEQVLFQNLATTAAQKLGLKFIGSDPAQLFCVENLLLTQVRPSEGLGFTLLPECADSLLPERVHLLCGIARPERFGASVEHYFRTKELKISIESYITVSDHGDISREALKLMASGDTLITTLKDFARWWRYAEIKEAIQGGRLFVMSLEVDFVDIDFKKFTLSFDKLFQFQ